MRIRTFLNTDTHTLASLWSAHYRAVGMDLKCPVQVFEECVLSKPYFDAQGIWIAFQGDRPIGFVHVSPTGPAEANAPALFRGSLSALCLVPDIDEDQVASELIGAGCRYLQALGCRQIVAAGGEDSPFYIGIGPGDGVMGVPLRDRRFLRWLDAANFRPASATQYWRLEIENFRNPIDRVQIQIRRQGLVSKSNTRSDPSWWRAAMFGHIEEYNFVLRMRPPSQYSAQAHFWQIDPSVAFLTSGNATRTMHLDMPSVTNLDGDTDRITFLLSESFRHLMQERVHTIKTVVSSGRTLETSMIKKLGFEHIESGTVRLRDLHAEPA